MKLKEFLKESSGTTIVKNVNRDERKIIKRLDNFSNLAKQLENLDKSLDLSKKVENIKTNLAAITKELIIASKQIIK